MRASGRNPRLYSCLTSDSMNKTKYTLAVFKRNLLDAQREVMSPTQTSTVEDQPLLNGANYIIWKTRVVATLDCKHLLGFVMKPNYDGLSDTEDDDVVMDLPDDDDELNPDRPEHDSSTPASPTDSLADFSEPPAILSFTEQRKEDTRRAASKRRPKPNKSDLRRREARAKMYLLSTLDNIHILLVRDKRTAYEIFATIRERYEDKSLHGDPYYIQSFLMELKYEEGTDLTMFFLKMEQALHACSIATNNSLSDEQQSIYLYHAMPTSWRNDLQIWKGTRKFIPYAELRHNIEQKVRDELAKTKYIVHKGSPESAETSAETALKIIDSDAKPPTALVSSNKHCDYCARDNHNLRECRVLQRDLHAGRVKGGTVLPENFVVHTSNRGNQPNFQRGFRNSGRPNGHSGNPNQRGYNRGYNTQHGRKRQSDDSVELFDRFGNAVSVDRNMVDFQQRNNSKHNDYGIIAITGGITEHVSLAATVSTPDLTWTVDSGCTRHITAVKDWFISLIPSNGAVTVGGKSEIPIEGTVTIRLTLADTKGDTRTIQLDNVLYAPKLQFNLLSVPNAVRNDFKITFDPKKCTLFYANRYKFFARLSTHADLYQFKAAPVADTNSTEAAAHLATTGHA